MAWIWGDETTSLAFLPIAGPRSDWGLPTPAFPGGAGKGATLHSPSASPKPQATLPRSKIPDKIPAEPDGKKQPLCPSSPPALKAPTSMAEAVAAAWAHSCGEGGLQALPLAWRPAAAPSRRLPSWLPGWASPTQGFCGGWGEAPGSSNCRHFTGLTCSRSPPQWHPGCRTPSQGKCSAAALQC